MDCCFNLESLPESFGNLSSLQTLSMDDCSKLHGLPQSFGNLSSLQSLGMNRCSNLKGLPESFGNLSSLQTLSMNDWSKLQGLPNSFGNLFSLHRLRMDGCKKMCRVSDNFGQLKCLKFLNISNCKELKRFPHDIVCLTSLAAVKAYGCAELEEKAMDGFVEIRSLMFLEMGECPLLIKRWDKIQQRSPLIAAALRFEGGDYPYREIMSTMFFSNGSRFVHVDGDGQLVEVVSSLFPEVGVKVGLLLTACALSDEVKQKLVEIASRDFQIIYVDVDVEGEGEGSRWMEEREKRIRKMLMELPQRSGAWISPFRKTNLLFAFLLSHFMGSYDTSVVGTSVVVDEEGRKKLSHPLETIFRDTRLYSRSRTLFSPLSGAWSWMVYG